MSVFNIQNSYYNLRTDTFTDCVLNIYFDLVEIERRNMEQEIAKNPNSWSHISACYNVAAKNIETVGFKFLSEVKRGQNLRPLAYWNDKVKHELKVDNLAHFRVDQIASKADPVSTRNREKRGR